MSSKINNLHLYLVFSTLDEKKAEEVCTMIREKAPSLSFSPFRIVESLNDCLECHASGKLDEEQTKELLAWLDNDWDWDEDETNCYAYGFNTKMPSELLYYIRVDI